jgi:MoaA/NifB/PqqE/SkfB family radical SAM enzyme
MNIYRLVRVNRFVRSHRLKFAGILAADVLNMRYHNVYFDPIWACNLRCKMCPQFGAVQEQTTAKRFSFEDIRRLAQLFFPNTIRLQIGCGAEPTMYRRVADVVRLGKDFGIPHIVITTNGQLLTENRIQELVTCGLDELCLSTHGVQKKTYEDLMVNASFERLLNVLSLLDKVKRGQASATPRLRLNYTINPDNLNELESFFDVYGKADISVLQLRPMNRTGSQKYAWGELDKPLYSRIVDALRSECRKRGIVFLATRVEANVAGQESTKTVDHGAVIYDAVTRHVYPNELVWRNDFDWKNESLRDYCKRVKWRRYLLKCIMSGIQHIPAPGYAARFDIG